ncbi:hypothetical protein GBA52_028015 [Prunus armeniaca]|nr:hypothetical protein GBA52_028015 [Prunus armeniaca]
MALTASGDISAWIRARRWDRTCRSMLRHRRRDGRVGIDCTQNHEEQKHH